MNAEKVKQIERQLERRGYKLYTKNLIGLEDYAYMRTVRDTDGELKYIISHGFYDWEDDKVNGRITATHLPSCLVLLEVSG